MSMSVHPQEVPYPKLPLWSTIGLSYSTYFRHFIDALSASWLWLVLVTPLTAVASWQQWSWMGAVIAGAQRGIPVQTLALPFEVQVLSNVDYLLVLLASVSIAVAWHRLMILGDHPGFSGSNVATRHLWRYIGIGLVIFLIFFLPAVIMFPMFYLFFPPLPGAGPPRAPFFVVLLAFVVLDIFAVAVALRLTLLLPARAVGDLRLTFEQMWNRTRGNAWRLFWGVAFTTVPPLLLGEIGVLFAGGGPPNPLKFLNEDFVARMTVNSCVFVIYYLLILPIGIGFLSHAYRHFFQAHPELRR